MTSEVNDIFPLLGKGFYVISVMISIRYQLSILMDVVIHMPQPHLSLLSFLVDRVFIGECSVGVELFLDGGEQLKTVF